jgi:integrase
MAQLWTETTIRRKRFDGSEKWHSIAGTKGLFFKVRMDGSYYCWRMRNKGQNFFLHIGNVNELTLAEAKVRAEAARKNVKSGYPPDYASISPIELTMQEAYDQFIKSEYFLKNKPSYQSVFRYRMEKYVVEGVTADIRTRFTKVGRLNLLNINEIEARRLWSDVAKHANENVAKAIKTHCKVIIDWAMQVLGVTLPTNPFDFSTPRLKKQNNATFFKDEELANVIIEFQQLEAPKRQFLNCVLLTGWRNGEIAKMRWDEIEYGVRVPNTNQIVTVWNSPGESNKSNQATRFVLTDRVVRQIESLPKLGEYVFSYGNRDAGGHDLPMTRPAKTVRKIFSKIGLSGEHKLHTLRHTMVTRLKEFDLSAADIDTFLGKRVREGSPSHNTYAHRDSILAKLRVADTWESHLVNLGFRG